MIDCVDFNGKIYIIY